MNWEFAPECPKCKGTGKTHVYDDFGTPTREQTCSLCHGNLKVRQDIADRWLRNNERGK